MKYGNKKTTMLGKSFDSKKEGFRYLELLNKQKKGDISDLQLQVVFELVPSVVLNGRKKPPIKYVADFVYTKTSGKQVVEDVKSEITRVASTYRIKKHLMKHVHGIEIIET